MEIIDADGHVNDIADQGKVQIDSAEKPSVHPSRASGRTEEPLKYLEIFPFMLSLSKHS